MREHEMEPTPALSGTRHGGGRPGAFGWMQERWENMPLRARLLAFAFLVAVGTLAVFGLLAEDVYEHESVAWDAQANIALHAQATPTFDAIMNAASWIGSGPVLVGLLLLSAGGLWFVRRRRDAAYLVVALVGSGLLNEVLKLIFQRARPQLAWSLPNPTYSFPSGHSMSSLVFFLGLAVVVWVIGGPRWGGIAVVCASLLVLAIGISRIYLGQHYLSDVIGGYSAGLCWLTGATVAVEGRRVGPQTARAARVEG